jgi:type VI secretion system protein ImpA
MLSEHDLERLLAPIAPDAPSGREPTYDPAFEALQAAAEPGREEAQDDDGRSLFRPRERDFGRIRRDALTLLEAGRDLRILVVLGESLAATEGPVGLEAGLRLIRRSLQDHWGTLYPELDPDEEAPTDAAAARLNALRRLVDPEGMLLELRRLPLFEAPGVGTVSLRALELARGEAEPLAYETRPDLASLTAAMEAAAPAGVAERLAALSAASAEIETIDNLLGDTIGDPAAVPDLSPLASLIARMCAALEPYATAPAPASQPASTAPAARPDAPLRVPEAVDRLAASLDTRDDAMRALELVADYFRRHEPGSPIPPLIERAQRLVPMSFIEIIAELAPAATPSLRETLGVKE